MDFNRLKRRGWTMGTCVLSFLKSIGITFVIEQEGNQLCFQVWQYTSEEGFDCIFESEYKYSLDSPQIDTDALTKMTELC